MLLVMMFIANTAQTMLMVVSMYLLISLVIYAPLNGLFPRLTLRKIAREIELWERERTDDQAHQIIEGLLDIPLKHALIVFFTSYPGFIIGPWLAYSGIVPDWQGIVPAVAIIAATIGFAVCSIQGFLVYTMSEERVRRTIEPIAARHPHVVGHSLQYRRMSLRSKVLILTFLAVIASQFSLASFVIAKFAIEIPDQFMSSIMFLGGSIILSVGYVFLAVRYFVNNIARSLSRLNQWSDNIINGKLDSEIAVVTNDELTDVVGNIREMVERLNTERIRVDDEREKLAVILSGIVDGVIAVNLDGEVILMNTAAERITGASKDESIGKPVHEVMVVYEDHKQLFTDYYYPIRSIITADEPSMNSWHALQLVQPNGTDRFVNIVVNPITSILGEGGCIIMFHDVTKEKELEEMKLDFVSIAAHELRTPLTSILGYLSVFIEENQGTLNEDQNLLLNRVQLSARQLGGLVENLLNVSKIERSVLTLSLQETDWYSIVEQTVSDLGFSAEEKRITLTFEEPDQDIPSVTVDIVRIKEVLSNLISNAINYTPPKGKVMVSVEVTPTDVITHIKDTGVGIPEEAIPRLFSKFYRVSSTPEQESKGTGLGLYISKAIVELHHGNIWVESQLDVGSTFSFSLPRSSAES